MGTFAGVAVSCVSRFRPRFQLLVAGLLGLGLAACSSGGGGSDAAGTGGFTVGGTLSGLDGTIVLQNNGGDDLSLTKSGTFAFATALADGDVYQVSIKSSPDEQTCAVTKGSGTIAAADVTDVAVSCATVNVSAHGSVQKGPFRSGSSVTIVELNSKLESSGTQFTTSTTNDLGHFSTAAAIEAPYVEIATQGFFFDEIGNGLSSAQITLRTVSQYVQGETINVNILTQLASPRMETLLQSGAAATFDEALALAKEDVLTMFKITASDIPDFDTLDITGTGVANAILIAASALLVQAATTADPDNMEAQLSELIANIGQDFAADGTLNDADIIAAVRQAGIDMDVVAVRSNLEGEYSELGEEITAAPFEDYIDGDGDGLVAIDDDNHPDSFADTTPFSAVDNVDPESVNPSAEVTVADILGNVRIKLSGGRLYVNCTTPSDPSACTPEDVTTPADSEAGTPAETKTIVALGDTLIVAVTASGDFSDTAADPDPGVATATLTIGDASQVFTVTTFPLTEMDFSIGSAADVLPGDTATSDIVIVTADDEAGTGPIYGFLPLTLSAGTLYRRPADDPDQGFLAVAADEETGITTTTVVEDDALYVELQAGSEFSTAETPAVATAMLTIGLSTADFAVTSCTQQVCFEGGVFVSTTGSDSNLGTIDQPLKTIQAGIDLAASVDLTVSGLTLPDDVPGTGKRPPVYVAQGSYSVDSSADTHVVMYEGVSVFGGFKTDWSARATSNLTQITDASTALINPNTTKPNRAVEIVSGSETGTITSATKLDGFVIKGGGGNFNDAIYIKDASPTISGNGIIAGIAQEVRAIDIRSSGTTTAPVISNNTINGADTASTARGVRIQNTGSNPTISGNQFSVEASSGTAYGIYATSGSASIAGNNFSYVHAATGSCTAIDVSGGIFNIANNTITTVECPGPAVGISVGSGTTANITGTNTISRVAAEDGDTSADGIYAQGATVAIDGATVSGVVMDSLGEGHNNGVHLYATGGSVSDSIIGGGTGYAISAGIRVEGSAPTADLTISGNTIVGGSADHTHGIVFNQATLASVSIEDNPSINGGTASPSDSYGIELNFSGATPFSISGNTISGGNASSGNNSYGIYIPSSTGTTDDVTVSNNTITGGQASMRAYGVFASGVDGLDMTGNGIGGGSSSTSNTYGVYLTQSPNATISAGRITGGTGTTTYGVYSDRGASSISDNIISAGGGTSTSTARGIQVQNAHTGGISISGNVIMGGDADTDTRGIDFPSGGAFGSPTSTITGNAIYGGRMVGIPPATPSTYGINIGTGTHTLRNNTIYGGNAGSGTSAAYGINISSADVTVQNNTINAGTGNTSRSIRLVSVSSNTITIQNNILFGGSYGIEETGGGQPDDLDNNDIYSTATALYYLGGSLSLTTTCDAQGGTAGATGTYGTSDCETVLSTSIASGNVNTDAGFDDTEFNKAALTYSNLLNGGSLEPGVNLTGQTSGATASFAAPDSPSAGQITVTNLHGIFRLAETIDNGASTSFKLAVPLSASDFLGVWRFDCSSPSSVYFGGLDLSGGFTLDKDGEDRTLDTWSMGAYIPPNC